MRRSALICLFLLLGCPERKAQPPTPGPPTSQPATPAATPIQQATAQASPRRPKVPALTFDLRPGVSQEQEGIKVTLERIAILPASEENLAKEPVEVTLGEASHYMALVLSVHVDGVPVTEITDERSLSLMEIALGMEKEVMGLRAGYVQELPDRPDAFYQCRPVKPFPYKHAPLRAGFKFQLDSGEELTFSFSDLKVAASLRRAPRPSQSPAPTSQPAEGGE